MTSKGKQYHLVQSAKVFFKPTDTRDKTYSHKFDPKGIPGVFAGYVVTTGQNWSRKYRVWDRKEFASVNLSMDAAVPRKLAQPYQTEVIYFPKEITFPLKAEYEKMKETLEGLKDNINLDWKEIKISVMMMTPQADHLVEVKGMMVWTTTGHLLIPEKKTLIWPTSSSLKTRNQMNAIEVMKVIPLMQSVTRF